MSEIIGVLSLLFVAICISSGICMERDAQRQRTQRKRKTLGYQVIKLSRLWAVRQRPGH